MTESKSAFANEIINGLSQKPKRLFSKYFYDDIGDKLFQQIMKMDEYYLTRSEYEIFSQQKKEILAHVCKDSAPIQLVEFGAGDGLKTKLLLAYLLENKVDFEYIPIDISASILNELKSSLQEKWPNLVCNPVADNYFNALTKLPSDRKKLVLFLGSNIGNFNFSEAVSFLTEVHDNLNTGDHFLMGVDLKKDPNLILDAYNDKQGITKSFNLNLLTRINNELGANFQIELFDHFPTYDPITGDTKSHLISKKEQTIYFADLDKTIHFKYAEPIFMEISKKYDIEELESLSTKTNFTIVEHFYDCKHYFTDTLWIKQ